MTARLQFLRDLFLYCEQSEIMLAYARPYAEEDLVRARDVDFVIEKDRLDHLVSWLKNIPGISLVWFYTRPDGASLCIYGIEAEQGNTLVIDFISSCSLKGIVYLDVAMALQRRVSFNQGFRLAGADQALILLMTHGVKHGGKLKEAYLSFINKVLQTDAVFTAALIRLFGLRHSLCVARHIRALSFPPAAARKSRRQFVWHSALAHPLSFSMSFIDYHAHELYCRFKTPHITIAFYGLDGAGKTTLIEEIKKDMAGTVDLILHCHFFPILPWQKEPDSRKAIAHPHAKAPRSGFISAAKAFVYFLRYWLAYLWPRQATTLMLYDRYMPDMLVDPIRYRYAGSSKFLYFLCAHLPPIALSVWVKTDPLIAHARKPELPQQKMMVLEHGYQDLGDHLPNFHVVDGTQPAHANALLVARHLFSFLKV